MTRLLLDIGNTRIKWAVQTDQGLDEQQAIAHAGLSVAQLGTQVFAPSGQVSQVLVSNVAGAALAEQVRQAARDCWQLEPRFAVATVTASVAGQVLHNAYAEPGKLGSDRWLAMLGALALQPHAVLVVSVGTAMTLDAVTADVATGEYRHLGGMIVPGPDLMISSLMHNTGDLAERARHGEPSEAFFADNTLGCMYQGSLQATVALIAATYARLQAQASDARLLLTGGAAPQVQAHLALPVQLVPDLVLQGLATLQ